MPVEIISGRPVAFIARSPFALLVRAESPVKNVDDLVARSKAAPGKFSLGNEGPRTFSGMIARLFNSRTGAEANLVPYASVGVGTSDARRRAVFVIVRAAAGAAVSIRAGRDAPPLEVAAACRMR